ncbi:MAG: hypothetical protein ABSE62_04890 [Chthoniobacteraceae bacterium]|jgi:hypothetical protein
MTGKENQLIAEFVREALAITTLGMETDSLEFWIGPRFVGQIRTCKLYDRHTGMDRLFLQTEERVKAVADVAGIPVGRMDSYNAPVVERPAREREPEDEQQPEYTGT